MKTEKEKEKFRLENLKSRRNHVAKLMKLAEGFGRLKDSDEHFEELVSLEKQIAELEKNAA
jgi:seryl-tRNA synthetase